MNNLADTLKAMSSFVMTVSDVTTDFLDGLAEAVEDLAEEIDKSENKKDEPTPKPEAPKGPVGETPLTDEDIRRIIRKEFIRKYREDRDPTV